MKNAIEFLQVSLGVTEINQAIAVAVAIETNNGFDEKTTGNNDLQRFSVNGRNDLGEDCSVFSKDTENENLTRCNAFAFAFNLSSAK